MTKLMEEAITHLRRLEPRVQDELARDILEDSLAGLTDRERSDIERRLRAAEAEFAAGQFAEGDAFWGARLERAKRVKGS